jgi:hypothetical protein
MSSKDHWYLKELLGQYYIKHGGKCRQVFEVEKGNAVGTVKVSD